MVVPNILTAPTFGRLYTIPSINHTFLIINKWVKNLRRIGGYEYLHSCKIWLGKMGHGAKFIHVKLHMYKCILLCEKVTVLGVGAPPLFSPWGWWWHVTILDPPLNQVVSKKDTSIMATILLHVSALNPSNLNSVRKVLKFL